MPDVSSAVRRCGFNIVVEGKIEAGRVGGHGEDVYLVGCISQAERPANRLSQKSEGTNAR